MNFCSVHVCYSSSSSSGGVVAGFQQEGLGLHGGGVLLEIFLATFLL